MMDVIVLCVCVGLSDVRVLFVLRVCGCDVCAV